VPFNGAQRNEMLRALDDQKAALLLRAHSADQRRRSARASAQFARVFVGRSRGAGARLARASLDVSRMSADQAHAAEVHQVRTAVADVEFEARWLRSLR
jgi:hypothetical protein